MTSVDSTLEAPTATTDTGKPLFTVEEIEQFAADDVQAGGAIGKMLSALFLYTVVAMAIAGWWTWSSINARQSSSSGASHQDQSAH